LSRLVFEFLTGRGGCLAHLIFLRAQMLVATLRLRTRRSIVCSIRRELPRFV